jgi:hypothetical protein
MSETDVINKITKYRLILAGYGFLIMSFILLSFTYFIGIKPPFDQLANTIGTSLFSISLISLVYEYFVKGAFVKEIENRLSKVFKNEFHEINQIKSSGIFGVFNNLPSDEVYLTLSNAQTEIMILQTWIPEKEHVCESIKKAIKIGVRVKILLLSPNSSCAMLRSAELGFKQDQVSIKIEDTIAEIQRVFSESLNDDFVSVRLYDGTPTMSIYAADNIAFMGNYWRGINASNGPHLKVSGEGSYYMNSINKNFELIWQSATDVEFD